MHETMRNVLGPADFANLTGVWHRARSKQTSIKAAWKNTVIQNLCLMHGSAFLSPNMIQKYATWSTMSNDSQWGPCCASGALLVATLQWKPTNMPKLQFTSIYASALFDGFLSNTPFSLLGTDLCGVSSFERQVLQVLTVSFLEVRFRASKKGRSAERRCCPQGGFITTSSTGTSIRAWPVRLQDTKTS